MACTSCPHKHYHHHTNLLAPTSIPPHSTHIHRIPEMPRFSISLLVLLLGALIPAPATALYSARSDVIQLTEENFKVQSSRRKQRQIQSNLELTRVNGMARRGEGRKGRWKGWGLLILPPPHTHTQAHTHTHTHATNIGESSQGRGCGPGGVLCGLVRALVRVLFSPRSLTCIHGFTRPSLPPFLPPSFSSLNSKNLVPEWDKAATALKGVVTVAAVDASVAQSLAQKYDVKVGREGGRDIVDQS